MGYIYIHVLKFIDEDSFEVRKSESTLDMNASPLSLHSTMPLMLLLTNTTDRLPIDYDDNLRAWVRIVSLQKERFNTSGVIRTEARRCVSQDMKSDNQISILNNLIK